MKKPFLSTNPLFLNEKQYKLFTLVDGVRCIRDIYKLSGVTYAHVYKLFVYYQAHGLVELRDVEGRKKQVHLTPYGKKLLQKYDELFTMVNNNGLGDRT